MCALRDAAPMGAPLGTLLAEIQGFSEGVFGKTLDKWKRNEEHPHGWLRTRGHSGSDAVLQDEGQPGHGLSGLGAPCATRGQLGEESGRCFSPCCLAALVCPFCSAQLSAGN